MPWSKASKFDAKRQRQFREAQRTEPAREAANDEPRVDLRVKRWAAVPIRPSSDVVGTIHDGDIEAALAHRRAAIYSEWRRRAEPARAGLRPPGVLVAPRPRWAASGRP